MFSGRSAWTDDVTGTTIEVACTDSSIDFTEREGADPVALGDALARLAATIGVPVARMSQVHGRDVVVVEGAEAVPVADAITTVRPGLALMARTADCVPVLLAAPDSGAVAAVHAGREGLVAGVVTAAVEALSSGSGERIRAWIGPHVCGRCYEVPAAMREEVSSVVPSAWAETSWSTPALDLGAGVESQLAALGVESARLGGCTMEDAGLWSHRRSGAAAGRMASVVWVSS